MVAQAKPRARKGGSAGGGKRLSVKGNLLTSLLLVFPLLVFYEIGVLFTDSMNGADFITQTLIHLLGIKGFVWTQVALIALFIALMLYLRRGQQFTPRIFVPVLLESGIYALTMGTLIIFVMVDLLGIDPRLAVDSPLAQAGIFDRIVLSVGAGVHEELVFRLVLMGGLTLIAEKVLNLRPWAALLLALIVSSVLFSLAHHLGPLGEPLRLGVFTYRFFAGVLFGVLFQFRGFAIAVYTHALYDIYVLLLA